MQRLAGQAANSPDDSLPFVLDDDAVAPAYEQALQQQQVEGEALPQQRAGPILHRPSFGHRNPASAAAGLAPCFLLCVTQGVGKASSLARTPVVSMSHAFSHGFVCCMQLQDCPCSHV